MPDESHEDPHESWTRCEFCWIHSEQRSHETSRTRSWYKWKKFNNKSLCKTKFRFQHRRQQCRTFGEQPPRFRSGLICRDSVRVHHLPRHHHHACGPAAQIPPTAPKALTPAYHHAVSEHAGHAQARWWWWQQQWLGAQRHHHPAQDCG